MARDEIIITELDGAFTYCRFYDGASFTSYDAEALTVAGTQKDLWADTSDFVYWGHSATFGMLGFRYHTAGSYGARTWEYWNGSAWTSFSPFYDGTSGFSAHGYIAWDKSVLTGWTANSVNSQSAYWVRASVASVTTQAKMYSFLANMTTRPPVVPIPPPGDIYTRDLTGEAHLKDTAFVHPAEIELECKFKTFSMAEINLLRLWHTSGTTLFIDDQAQSSTPDPTEDAYYQDYTGHLVALPGHMISPHKMKTDAYNLRFSVHDATPILTR